MVANFRQGPVGSYKDLEGCCTCGQELSIGCCTHLETSCFSDLKTVADLVGSCVQSAKNAAS